MNRMNIYQKRTPEEFERIESARSFLGQYAVVELERADYKERIEKLSRQREEVAERFQKESDRLQLSEEGRRHVEKYRVAHNKHVQMLNKLIDHFKEKYDKLTGTELNILTSIENLDAGRYTDDMKEIILMRYIDGMAWHDISKKLCLSTRTCQEREQLASLLLIYTE